MRDPCVEALDKQDARRRRQVAQLAPGERENTRLQRSSSTAVTDRASVTWQVATRIQNVACQPMLASARLRRSKSIIFYGTARHGTARNRIEREGDLNY